MSFAKNNESENVKDKYPTNIPAEKFRLKWIIN